MDITVKKFTQEAIRSISEAVKQVPGASMPETIDFDLRVMPQRIFREVDGKLVPEEALVLCNSDQATQLKFTIKIK